MEITSGKDHIMLGTKSGLAIRFEETDVRAMGRRPAASTGRGSSARATRSSA